MQKKIKILDKEFELYISAEQIQIRVKELADILNKKFSGQNPVFLSILNGSLFFTADLTRQINFNSEISFIKTASYTGIKSSGKVKSLIGIENTLEGRHIIIIEDIIDTGLTLNQIIINLKKFNPAQIDIITLLLKPNDLNYNLNSDYVGFKVPDRFLVGYGMDYNQQGRHLKDIYQLVN